jgi:hypothetical protein
VKESQVNRPELDAEKLAALMDGRLNAPERADLLARLAASPEDLEVHGDAAAVLGELEPEPSKALPFAPRAADGRRRVYRWLAAAAILAGIALVGPLFQVVRRSAPPVPGRFTETLLENGALLPAGLEERPWTTVRGGGTEPLTSSALAARAGALAVDLEIAVWSRDSAAPRLAGELALLLSAVPAGAPVAAMYRLVAQRSPDVSAYPEEVRPLLQRAGAAASELTEPHTYHLAAWAEAARIAAAQRDRDFFRAGESRSALEWASQLTTLPRAERATVERIRSALSDPGGPNWTALERDLIELLRLLGS